MDATGTLPSKPLDFDFSGKGWEFFKIWIVNILLTILTLGIYSAWAKVRSKRYFYGNTAIAGSAFEYTADPISILIGRVIVLGIFLLYIAGESTFPILNLLFPIIVFLALPWLMVRALMFNARYSSYRNISFSFNNDIKGAVITFLLLGLLVVITAGLAFPYYYYRVYKFMIGNHNYGNLRFDINSVWKNFYIIFLIALLIPIGLTIAAFMVFKLIGIDLSGLSQLAVEGAGQPLSGVGIGIILIGAYVLSLFLYLFIYAYVRTNILNTVWSNVNVGGNSFESYLSVKGMMWIYFTNGLGILLTLGLFTPWAMVRMTRYRINRLKVWADSNINEVIAKQQKEVSATGGEMSDFLDVDLAI